MRVDPLALIGLQRFSTSSLYFYRPFFEHDSRSRLGKPYILVLLSSSAAAVCAHHTVVSACHCVCVFAICMDSACTLCVFLLWYTFGLGAQKCLFGNDPPLAFIESCCC